MSSKFNALKKRGVKRDKKRRLQSARKHRERLVCPEHDVPLVKWQTQFGPRWQCDHPGCTVACWSGVTSSPADDRTRAIRHECHNQFDPLWKNGGLSRDTAYEKLAEVMGMSFKDCHIGLMDYEQCQRVLRWLQARG